MSRWLHQMSERRRTWSFEDFCSEVKEGDKINWLTRKLMYAHDAPAAGDIIVCFFAPSACFSPGICAFGVLTKYLPKKRRFDWLPLPPTNQLKQKPWWDDRAEEVIQAVRRNSVRGTIYQLPAGLETDLRRGLYAWAGF